MRLTLKALSSLVAIGVLAACSGANLAGSVTPSTGGFSSNQTMTIPCHCTHPIQAGVKRQKHR